MRPDKDMIAQVCGLRTWEKLSYLQIARQTGLSKGQIGRILMNAGLTSAENALFPDKRRVRREPLPPAVGALPAAPPQIGIPDVQRARRLCQWIFGEPGPGQHWIDMDKCNEAALPGKPYCEGHCARAYHASRG